MCSFVDTDALAQAGIELKSKTPATGTPPVVGGCSLLIEGGLATIDAWPAADFDAHAGSGTDTPGLGEKAIATEGRGLFVKLAGKPFALQFTVTTGGNLNSELAATLAQTVVAAAAK